MKTDLLIQALQKQRFSTAAELLYLYCLEGQVKHLAITLQDEVSKGHTNFRLRICEFEGEFASVFTELAKARNEELNGLLVQQIKKQLATFELVLGVQYTETLIAIDGTVMNKM